ncbi:DUF916 and DUF3324 domain-containing protein [Lactiplantibacillus nangangensis]|uniref:DUF916 and DUF3324 domain-containing protein n=1 Tax=Lactiplantibacillus nangangensis TaxID=2559917 RepID=A0ABW1SGZ6_9LACO|nr:DUF916 and DUF3324 domain-containing protein [Lactiplantibacillus nangangensis]
MKLKSWLVGLLASVSLLLLALPGQAEQNQYAIRAVLPSNQVDQETGYFDLKVSPKQEQTIYVRIKNEAATKQQYDVATNLALTGDSGTIVYNQAKPKLDKTLPFNIADTVTAPKIVTVPAKTTSKFALKLKIPAKPFDGIVLGGINVSPHEQANQKRQAGVTLQNKFAYVLGLQLREQANITVKPDLKLLKVAPRQENYRNYIAAKLHNPRSVIIHDFHVDSYVVKQGSTKKQLQTTKDKMLMAPNSTFHFDMGDGTMMLTPGTYMLHLKANSENGKYKWSFTKSL